MSLVIPLIPIAAEYVSSVQQEGYFGFELIALATAMLHAK